jgi:hypothetical protein
MLSIIAATLAATLSAPAHAATGTWGEKRPDFTPAKRSSESNAGTPLLDNDILLGVKGGFQNTFYTDVSREQGKDTPLTNGLGYATGAAFLWKLGWSRLEIDLFLDSRKQGDRSPVPYVGVPVLLKFAPTENRKLTWNLGAGGQVDTAIGGSGTRRNVLAAFALASDLMVDIGGPFLTIETRFLFGMTTYDQLTTGGRPRDFDFLLGIMLPIDRE